MPPPAYKVGPICLRVKILLPLPVLILVQFLFKSEVRKRPGPPAKRNFRFAASVLPVLKTFTHESPSLTDLYTPSGVPAKRSLLNSENEVTALAAVLGLQPNSAIRPTAFLFRLGEHFRNGTAELSSTCKIRGIINEIACEDLVPAGIIMPAAAELRPVQSIVR